MKLVGRFLSGAVPGQVEGTLFLVRLLRLAALGVLEKLLVPVLNTLAYQLSTAEYI